MEVWVRSDLLIRQDDAVIVRSLAAIGVRELRREMDAYQGCGIPPLLAELLGRDNHNYPFGRAGDQLIVSDIEAEASLAGARRRDDERVLLLERPKDLDGPLLPRA
jgi:hypothetical protein